MAGLKSNLQGNTYLRKSVSEILERKMERFFNLMYRFVHKIQNGRLPFLETSLSVGGKLRG